MKKKTSVMKMRNGKKTMVKKANGMKTSSRSTVMPRVGEGNQKKGRLPRRPKPKNIPLVSGPPAKIREFSEGMKTAPKKKMMNGMKTGVGKKKFAMRGMDNGGKVENFQDYVKRMFGGGQS